MSMILLILQLLRELSPEIVELVLLVRKKDGGISVIPILDEADEKFKENIKKIEEWKREQE